MGIKERRLREKEQRKEQILDAARTLIVKDGLAATSVHQIAKMTELSVGTIYLYFRSKEEIFSTLQEEGLDILQKDLIDKCKNNSNSAAKMKALARAYLDFAEEQKKYFEIFNYFISSPTIIFSKQLKSRIDKHGSQILSIVESIIKEGIDKGEFENLDTLNCALGYWGTLHGLIQFKKLRNTIYKHENFEELYFFNVDLMIRGLTKRGKGSERKTAGKAQVSSRR